MHVSVIGAGSVGVAVASSILHGGHARRLSIFDLAGEKAAGEALDFAHASPMLGDAEVDGGAMDAVVAGDVCVITAGVKQRPGESRQGLLERNRTAIRSIAEAIETRGLPRIAIVVTNPVDAMTHALASRWRDRGTVVFGSGTLLDTLRLRAALARRLSVSGESVHAYVIGEHGDSSVSLLESAEVGGLPIAEVARRRGIGWDPDAEWSAAHEGVRSAAYRVIERKGATCHAIGIATARIVRAIARDQRAVLPVSVAHAGVSISLPAIVGREGATSLGVPSWTAREAAAFEASLGVVRGICA
jgi:L-lactate dehydrogenase